MSFLLPFFSSRRYREAFSMTIHDKRDNEGSEWGRMTARQRTKIGRKAVRTKELIKRWSAKREIERKRTSIRTRCIWKTGRISFDIVLPIRSSRVLFEFFHTFFRISMRPVFSSRKFAASWKFVESKKLDFSWKG